MMLKNDGRWLTHLTTQAERSIAFTVLGDQDTQAIQARISLEKFGNVERQARKGQPRIQFGHFGMASTEEAILGSEVATERAAKRKQLTLDNVLRLGHLPRPSGPR
jgi:hypothetical protein